MSREVEDAMGMWLVTGGAGYVGAHVVRDMVESGLSVVVFDDLSSGVPARLPAGVALVQGDCRDAAVVNETCRMFGVTGVIHLAARKQARESHLDPLGYWGANVGAVLGLMEGLSGTSVRSLVFSSSCSVYGEAGAVDEEAPVAPVSPYGRAKVVSESIIADCARQLGIAWVSLRYFNVIGNGAFDMAHDTSEECLVPAALRRWAAGQQPVVFGTDHDTPDGTCLRDYVDVRDLARAHHLAARLLDGGDPCESRVLNVAVGRPVSVLQVLATMADVIGADGQIDDAGRRAGDPSAVWARGDLVREVLGWEPQHDLRSSVEAHVQSVGRQVGSASASPRQRRPGEG